jgi:hypothetical protein
MTNSEIAAAPNTSAVELATVLAGARSFKDLGIPNVSDTYRGQILIGGGEVRTAIIKDIPVRELANEVVTAALGAALSLPVPKAYIALAEPAILATNHAPRLGSASLLFASTDVFTPSVAQIVVGSDFLVALKRVAAILLKSSRLGSLYAFDAWLANIDRHIGNLLLGPDVYLIDHGRCYTGPTWTAADLRPAVIFRQRLKEWLTPVLPDVDRKRIATEAAAMTIALSKVDIEGVGTANRVPALLGDADFMALVDFLKERIVHVPRIAGDALEQPMVA